MFDWGGGGLDLPWLEVTLSNPCNKRDHYITFAGYCPIWTIILCSMKRIT